MARALLKDAPILVLEEPTAALETISEQAVFAAMERLRDGRTTAVVASRLSTVRGADRILILDGGHIVAERTHDELQQLSPLNRCLCAQLERSQLAATAACVEMPGKLVRRGPAFAAPGRYVVGRLRPARYVLSRLSPSSVLRLDRSQSPRA